VIHQCAGERWAGAGGVGDGEGVLGEGVQDTSGIVEELEGLVTGVGDGGGDLQVLQSVDIDIGGCGLEGQTGGCRDGDRRGNEGQEGSTKGGREHCKESGCNERGECGESDRRGNFAESLKLDEPGLNTMTFQPMAHGCWTNYLYRRTTTARPSQRRKRL